MAIPTAQTATTICTEALKRCGYSNPSATQISHAETEHLRDALDEICMQKDWKLLEYEFAQTLSDYVSELVLPTALDKLLHVKLLRGNYNGTLQAGGTSSITLAAAEDMTESGALGKPIFLLSGTNAGRWSRITAYDATTKVASIAPDFPAGVSTDSYLVVDSETDLNINPHEDGKMLMQASPPTAFHIYDGQSGSQRPELRLNGYIASDDTVYALWYKYTLDLDQVDLTDGRMTRIYDRLRAALIAGIKAGILDKDDDDRATKAELMFRDKIKTARRRDNMERSPRTALGFRSVGGLPTGQ